MSDTDTITIQCSCGGEFTVPIHKLGEPMWTWIDDAGEHGDCRIPDDLTAQVLVQLKPATGLEA